MNTDFEEGTAIDRAFISLFDAYERVAKLERVQTAPEAREAATRIKVNMESFINAMVGYGIRSQEAWTATRRRLVRH